MNTRSLLRAGALIALLALLLWTPSARAEYEEHFTYSTQSLKVVNLIGAVDVRGHDGDEFVVDVRVSGEDAEPGVIDFDSSDGRRAELVIGFPVDDERRYVYPEMGRGSRTSFNPGHDSGGLWGFFGRGKIEVRGSGRGMELWADVTILVPEGAELIVFNGVGKLEGGGANANLELNLRSGSAYLHDTVGELIVDTGSGSVEIDNQAGDLLVDTGSGHVEVTGLRGDRVSIDTGSGHVGLRDAEVPRIHVDTGSGHVEMDRIVCDDLEVDTGSGHVEADDLSATSAMIDTGSGRVRLELTSMGNGEFDIDTGSGSITLLMPENPSARVEAETNSGGIDVDIPGAEFRRQKRDHVRFEVGGGEASVRLDAGSGGIRIASR